MFMKLTFIGAAHEVTGSCHYLEAAGKHMLIDCGMEQGPDLYENQQLPIDADEVDYVVLTHAHIDHSGLLPLLYAKGFRGTVFCTQATRDLCNIMLKDSAYIQEFEAEWRNRKAKRSGGELYEPLYTTPDAEGVLELFEACVYGQKLNVSDQLYIRFTDAGHLLGSACIEVWVNEKGVSKKLVFSGDIGNPGRPIVKDPEPIQKADYIIMESTYGNRYHEEAPDYKAELTTIMRRTFERGGNVVIPSFAVGRTQEMLYLMREIKAEELLPEYDFEVYVDSPLAIEATNIFGLNIKDCFDDNALALVEQGINPIRFEGLKTTITSEESKAINFDQKPKVILSASGMCEAGRIKHHLKHNLWRPECTILFVGYQAHGTLGRRLTEGARQVKLFGETVEVRAEIATLHGVSGHADKNGLLQWLGNFEQPPERVFVVHGADEVCDEFAETVRETYAYEAVAPYTGAVFDLQRNTCLEAGSVVRKQPVRKPAKEKQSKAFEQLLQSGRRLLKIIRTYEHGANKDLTKFNNQVRALCEKWEKFQ